MFSIKTVAACIFKHVHIHVHITHTYKHTHVGHQIHTVTGLRVARLLRHAHTSVTAISRLRISASSSLDPATTRFGACTEGRKAAMHRN